MRGDSDERVERHRFRGSLPTAAPTAARALRGTGTGTGNSNARRGTGAGTGTGARRPAHRPVTGAGRRI